MNNGIAYNASMQHVCVCVYVNIWVNNRMKENSVAYFWFPCELGMVCLFRLSNGLVFPFCNGTYYKNFKRQYFHFSIVISFSIWILNVWHFALWKPTTTLQLVAAIGETERMLLGIPENMWAFLSAFRMASVVVLLFPIENDYSIIWSMHTRYIRIHVLRTVWKKKRIGFQMI